MNLLKQLFSRRRRYADLSESIREHLEEKTEELMESGMSREEADRRVRREFGNVALTEQRSREVWQWPTLESIWADVARSKQGGLLTDLPHVGGEPIHEQAARPASP